MPNYGPPAPVPIFQHDAEFRELLNHYRKWSPQSTLEVGTYHGGTLYHWLQEAPLGAVVVSVDSYAVGVDNRDLYNEWCPLGISVVAICGDTRAPETVAAAEEYAPYDFCFIDAGHYLNEVTNDWEVFSPLVRKGGRVAFHDILPKNEFHPEIEVSQLWDVLKEEYETEEIVEDRGAAWGGIGIVYLP